MYVERTAKSNKPYYHNPVNSRLPLTLLKCMTFLKPFHFDITIIIALEVMKGKGKADLIYLIVNLNYQAAISTEF